MEVQGEQGGLHPPRRAKRHLKAVREFTENLYVDVLVSADGEGPHPPRWAHGTGSAAQEGPKKEGPWLPITHKKEGNHGRVPCPHGTVAKNRCPKS